MTADYRYDLGLFSATGVELEYMIVDRETLDVRPIADQVLRDASGEIVSDLRPGGDEGPVEWSNELCAHLLEMKTAEPAPSLEGLAALFQSSVRDADARLAPLGARLMPTAMHPWMDPAQEMRLWTHDYSPVYSALDRVFSCKGHGWSNLQSCHINLPFASDEEFGRLHAAIRLVLPILPALAASSPAMEGRVTGLADTRLDVYRTNARRVPICSGRVIPEPYFTRSDYESKLLESIYEAIRPLDPDGILQHEWLNSRGCIARFMRGAIEIRVLDVQECPAADLAIVGAVVALVKAHTENRWADQSAQRAFGVEPLHEILLACINDADRAVITNTDYLRAFGVSAPTCTAGELWRRLVEALSPASGRAELSTILDQGPLTRRLTTALGAEPSRADLRRVYARLCDCLHEGRLFLP